MATSLKFKMPEKRASQLILQVCLFLLASGNSFASINFPLLTSKDEVFQATTISSHGDLIDLAGERVMCVRVCVRACVRKRDRMEWDDEAAFRDEPASHNFLWEINLEIIKTASKIPLDV